MDHLITYISHIILRGVIYKIIYKLPFSVALILGGIACFILVSRYTKKLRKAKVKK